MFTIRSSRAIEEESEVLTNDYVGKGDIINLLIPDRDDKLELLRKIIDRIQVMDDESFNKFVNLVIHRIQQNKEYKDVNIVDVIITLSKV